MEMEIQQYEKAKAVREEQLDRLTQICQEQAVSSVHSNLQHLSFRSAIFTGVFTTNYDQQRAAKHNETRHQ